VEINTSLKIKPASLVNSLAYLVQVIYPHSVYRAIVIFCYIIILVCKNVQSLLIIIIIKKFVLIAIIPAKIVQVVNKTTV
jgi:hypothetical protein